MPTWDADLYLRFANERTQPCRDLAARVVLPSPREVIDLGCGPGNSTAVLVARWPEARITGLDSSKEMIDAARKADPGRRWVVGDIQTWSGGGERFDLIFSNAAMQWVADHGPLFVRLMGQLAAGGALAVQMPCNFDAPAHTHMRDLAASAKWRNRFPGGGVREWGIHDPGYYYDALAPHAARIDLWQTEYMHVMADAGQIVEWYKGTGLRPFLGALANEGERSQFIAEYLELIHKAYPSRGDGRVLFPFQRLFIVAYRGDQ